MDTLTKPGYVEAPSIPGKVLGFLRGAFGGERRRRALIENRLNAAKEAAQSDPGLLGKLAKLVHEARQATIQERSATDLRPLPEPQARIDGGRAYTALIWRTDLTAQGSLRNPFNGSDSRHFSLKVETSVDANANGNPNPQTTIGLAWGAGREGSFLTLSYRGENRSTITGAHVDGLNSRVFELNDTQQAAVTAQVATLLSGPGEYTVS